MVIYIQYKFQEISFIGHLVMAAENRKIKLIFRQTKGDNTSITHDTLMKLHMHSHTIVIYIYIQYKFNDIPSIGYLVMTEDIKIIEI